MAKKITLRTALPSCLIAAWVVALNCCFIVWGVADTWPVFFASIFFFMLGADGRAARMVYGGGFCGIAAAGLLVKCALLLTPLCGTRLGLILPLAVIICVIIILEPLAPCLLNNVAFGFLTISMVKTEMLLADVGYLWHYLTIFVVGGSLILGGCALILRWCRRWGL